MGWFFIGAAVGGAAFLADATRVAKASDSPKVVAHLREAGLFCWFFLALGVMVVLVEASK